MKLYSRNSTTTALEGTPHNVFCSYRSNGKQFTKLGETKSSYMSIPLGVPQGSVLGPLRFLRYI